MQVELFKPIMSYININGTGYELYLKPGYDLKLSMDTTDTYDSIMIFEGKGAPANNYINHVTALLNSQDLIGLDLDTFAKKYDSLNIAIENFSRSYFERFPMQNEEVELLRHIKKIKLLERRVYYAHRVHNDALVEQVLKLQKGEPVGKIERLDEVQNFFSDIPFDTAYLGHGMVDYEFVLEYYAAEKFLSIAELSLLDSPYRDFPPLVKARWPRQVHTLLNHESYPPGIKEYLMAANLVKWVNSQGITPEIDSLFNEFKLEFGESNYTTELQELYDEYSAILPGNTAPDFSGSSPDGELISLKDFKGKVVYVDLWATWCGPCVEQIPYAKELHHKFPHDKVIFLNVSVDQNAEAWKRMLDKEYDWLGIHIILDEQEHENLLRNYKVAGVPKYFLIDQSGKIVSARASRPSSKNIREEIKSLL
jgi:thiol-disulfide isomerase/thioredoxin